MTSRLCASRSAREAADLSGRASGLDRARELIDSNFTKPLGVHTLARSAALSQAHFSREFRRVFGVSPHRYLMGRRLEHAAMLLRTTERPVMEICRTVGLRSVTSFTTLFGLTYGFPPSAYRAAHGTGARAHAIERSAGSSSTGPDSSRPDK